MTKNALPAQETPYSHNQFARVAAKLYRRANMTTMLVGSPHHYETAVSTKTHSIGKTG
ncbi:MAG: hypothetical protein KDE56_09250 [Anaerolineales bacterium]|nr:hypothetical protein [Anaerolineales bacterium]